MSTDLQAALKRYDEWMQKDDRDKWFLGDKTIHTLADAACLVADPNIEAGAKARYEHYVEGLKTYPLTHEPWLWEELPPGPKAKWMADTEIAVAAALTGDTDDPL